MSKQLNQIPKMTEMEKKVQRVLGIKVDEVKSPEELEADELAKRNVVARSITKKLKESLKPLGYYPIPDLLDKRRIYYGIPNEAFELYPTYDKCWLWQIPLNEKETYADGGMIIRPDANMSYDRKTAPRGILISAGLQAMDTLYATGCEIGHIVRFKKMSPFNMPIAEIDGHTLHVMVVTDGDIEASEDMATAINGRRAVIQNVGDSKKYDFRYIKDGVVSGEKVKPYFDESI